MVKPPSAVHPSAELPARLLRVALLFAIGFLVVRTALVEPFGVPTGSMAPTLLGNHREAPCPRCGHPVVVGELPGAERRNPYANATCDNCGRRGIDLTHSVDLPGDRLLVDKNVFSLRPPRRWELAVFRCPVDTSTPYVKRVVGLPGEQIQILGGDVFVNGEILRKSYGEFKEMMVPVFDSNFEPESGWKTRWLVKSDGQMRPANKAEWNEGILELDATKGKPVSAIYHNVNIDTLREEPINDLLTYNAGLGLGKIEPVFDFHLTFELEVVLSEGELTISLTDGLNRISGNIELFPNIINLSLGDGNKPIPSRSKYIPDFSIKPKCQIELGIVDRRTRFAINGNLLMTPQDLPADPTTHGKRFGVSNPFQFEIRGGSVRIRNVKLTRDVHYRTDGANGIAAPFQLGPDDYFVLGDNSANSRDSRVWKIPGVPRESFLGKLFLIHQPMHLGRVPLNGQDRTFPTLDWQRLRWVR